MCTCNWTHFQNQSYRFLNLKNVPKSKLKGLKIERTRLKPTHGRPPKKEKQLKLGPKVFIYKTKNEKPHNIVSIPFLASRLLPIKQHPFLLEAP